MLDYEVDVKQHAINLLAGDLFGKGRVESAVYHTFQHVYEKGHEEGLALGLAKNNARTKALKLEVEKLQGTIRDMEKALAPASD